MTELTTAQSFMVRIYRIDPQDPSRLTGQIELLDGSGVRIPFSGCNELTAVLSRTTVKRTKRKQPINEQDPIEE
jgi:hypothetical protein